MIKLEQTITSLEIAEMVGWEHKRVLRKIDGFFETAKKGKDNETINGLVKMFVEDTYKDAKGEERKMYRATKQGCQLFGNKMKDLAGLQFSIKYIARFNEMEDELKKQQEEQTPQLTLEDKLYIALGRGGIDAIEAHKQLEQIKMKPLIEENKYKQEIIDTHENLQNLSLKNKRTMLVMIIQKNTHDGKYSKTWNLLYEEFNRKCHKNVQTCAKNRNMSTINYIVEELEMIDELLETAITLFEVSEERLIECIRYGKRL